MKATTFLTACTLFSVCLSSLFAAIGDKATLPSFNGKPLYGPPVTPDELRGKVIFFEYWGIHCPPCRASMPHLQEMQRKYQDKGFTVIGSHCQHSNPEVETFLKENKVTFPVYQMVSIAEAPCPGGLPFAALIGADGRVVAMGYPSALYDKVEAEVAKIEAGYPILEGLKLKKYKPLSKSITSNGRNLDAKIAPLREEAAAGDQEAADICNAFDVWIEGEKSIIRTQCGVNPLHAMKSIARLKTIVPSVTEFDERLLLLRQSPKIQKLLEVQKKISSLQRNRDKGRRISVSSVNALGDTVDQLKKMEGEDISRACDDLTAQLLALTPSTKKSGARRQR